MAPTDTALADEQAERIGELERELVASNAEVERLKVYDDMDQNQAQCEACQRYTPQEHMRDGDEGPQGEGGCCMWCLRIDTLRAEVERLLKHVEEVRGVVICCEPPKFPENIAARKACLGEGYDLIRTMGGRQPCSQCSGTGTRVYVADSLERCKDCGGNGYANVRE